jgi:hypothetical protein
MVQAVQCRTHTNANPGRRSDAEIFNQQTVRETNMADLNIDSTQYDDPTPPKGTYTPLPLGVYTFTIVRALMKKTKPGTPEEGIQEEIEFDISSPTQFNNRKHWERYPILNGYKDENGRLSLQEDARKKVAQLGRASGIFGNVTEEGLIGRTVQARIATKKKKDWTDKHGNVHNNEVENYVVKYYPVGVDADAEDKKSKGAAPAANQPAPAGTKPNWGNVGAPAPAPAQPATTTAAAPWKR